MQAIRAAEIESPSREELLASLKTSEEESKKLSRLLNNQYGKNSRQLKYHLQTVAGFQSELEQLKKSNDTLLTQKKSLEKLVASLRAEMASKMKPCNLQSRTAISLKCYLVPGTKCWKKLSMKNEML